MAIKFKYIYNKTTENYVLNSEKEGCFIKLKKPL